MTRHGKNCTAGAVYTYHEKKKDTAASGYGTQNIRLSRDAVKDFDCCCLSLQPCHDPVVTPDGYLYEREAILEYILYQKKEIARQMKAYEKQRGARREEQKELQRAAAQDQVRGFLEKEAAIVSRPLNPFTPKAASGNSPDDARPGSSAGPTGKDKDKALPSFWIPSLTPEAKATKLEKPSRTVTCPMSGKPLRMSDLTPVRFTPLDSSVDRVGLITRSERYVCAVTRDSLSNATPCAVLRPSGAVVTLECVEKLIRKDMVDPVNGEKLTDRDIIVLQRGGTGFAGSGGELPGFPAPLLHCQGDRKAQVEVKTAAFQNQAAQDSTSPCATPHPTSPPQAGRVATSPSPSKARGPRPELRTQEPTPSLTSSPETTTPQRQVEVLTYSDTKK
uniref:Nitric oxide synthase-interacting protein n=1 Tax=Ailuropoda melanoleuca TaxID=9646 RepID=A0A7N5JAH5_AILME